MSNAMIRQKVWAIGLGAAFAVAVILPPAIALAETNLGEGSKAGFCNKIATISANFEERFGARGAKLDAKRAAIESKIKERRAAHDAKLAQVRAKWDANRAAHYAKLEAKAQTDAQKQAVADFKKAVEAAVAVRRAAIDKAIDDFRDGVDAAHAARKSAIDEVITTYENSVLAALEKAAADCEAEVAPVTVRANLTAAVKAAREKFVADRKSAGKVKDTMETLIAGRKANIQKAIDDFKAALDAAREDLKAAWPQG